MWGLFYVYTRGRVHARARIRGVGVGGYNLPHLRDRSPTIHKFRTNF